MFLSFVVFPLPFESVASHRKIVSWFLSPSSMSPPLNTPMAPSGQSWWNILWKSQKKFTVAHFYKSVFTKIGTDVLQIKPNKSYKIDFWFLKAFARHCQSKLVANPPNNFGDHNPAEILYNSNSFHGADVYATLSMPAMFPILNQTKPHCSCPQYQASVPSSKLASRPCSGSPNESFHFSHDFGLIFFFFLVQMRGGAKGGLGERVTAIKDLWGENAFCI